MSQSFMYTAHLNVLSNKLVNDSIFLLSIHSWTYCQSIGVHHDFANKKKLNVIRFYRKQNI